MQPAWFAVPTNILHSYISRYTGYLTHYASPLNYASSPSDIFTPLLPNTSTLICRLFLHFHSSLPRSKRFWNRSFCISPASAWNSLPKNLHDDSFSLLGFKGVRHWVCSCILRRNISALLLLLLLLRTQGSWRSRYIIYVKKSLQLLQVGLRIYQTIYLQTHENVHGNVLYLTEMYLIDIPHGQRKGQSCRQVTVVNIRVKSIITG